ncbi:hypothetical protein [Rhizobium sp. FKY42]|uniref:hypothetical protein n=1 Tax=Rhizobium sp. FKY42 TaxID=2562310 RepID=UPI001485C086|nr:hypothetical protein [Rhizobium sp. FKY42]
MLLFAAPASPLDKERHLPVVDADRKLASIVSQSNLLTALFQSELDRMAITRRR